MTQILYIQPHLHKKDHLKPIQNKNYLIAMLFSKPMEAEFRHFLLCSVSFKGKIPMLCYALH